MDHIRVRREGTQLWVTFSRPEKANALSAGDLPELRDTIADLPAGVSAIVFTGEGTRAFSGGLNVTTFLDLDRDTAEALISQLAAVMTAIRRSPVVSVAAINGVCLGAAFELALACDLRVVSTAAAFGLPEVKVGIPSVIEAALLPHFVGLSRAREMTLTGDIYTLTQLPAFSLANVVCEPADLVEATKALLDRVAGHTRTVTASQRRLFDTWLNHPLDASIAASIKEFGAVFGESDTQAQIDSYVAAMTSRSREPPYRDPAADFS